jgi:hypothetical protein
MTDPGIADTLNRQTARLLVRRLDSIDQFLGFRNNPWFRCPIAATLMGENDASDADRGWLIGSLLPDTGNTLTHDSYPADGDWENLLSHIRDEITSRRERDPQAPLVRAAETPARDGVGSQ